MPYNLPTVTTSNISLGPGTIAIGPSGSTPVSDVGTIGDDGVTLEITSEKADVRAGNPPLIVHSMNKAQDVKISWQGVEWNNRLLQYSLGAGVTLESASLHTFTFGGTPIVTTVAIQVVHQMAAGQTYTTRIWKARGDGSVQIKLGNDPHQFPSSYMAMQSSTNWAGASLLATDQLIQTVRNIT